MASGKSTQDMYDERIGYYQSQLDKIEAFRDVYLVFAVSWPREIAERLIEIVAIAQSNTEGALYLEKCLKEMDS